MLSFAADTRFWALRHGFSMHVSSLAHLLATLRLVFLCAFGGLILSVSAAQAQSCSQTVVDDINVLLATSGAQGLDTLRIDLTSRAKLPVLQWAAMALLPRKIRLESGTARRPRLLIYVLFTTRITH